MAINNIERCRDGCRTSLLTAGVVLVNPRRLCTANRSRRVCLSVCVPLSHISPLGLLTHSAGNEGQKIVAFSLKLRRSRAIALLALYGYRAIGHFLTAEYTRTLLKWHALTVGRSWVGK